MQRKLPEIKLDDFTPEQFAAIQQSGKFKIKGQQAIFAASKASRSTTATMAPAPVKREFEQTATFLLSCYTDLSYSGNEYWFKLFPLYKKSGSLKMFDTLNHGDKYLKEYKTENGCTASQYKPYLDQRSPITRTPNPYGWAALSGTVLTIAAAATYGYLKLFSPSTK